MPDEPFEATVVVSAGGPPGPAGAAATIAVGTTTTTAPGGNAAVTNVGTSTAATFNFDIPRGATGPTGPQGPPGSSGAGTGDVLGPATPTVIGNVALWADTSGTVLSDSGLTLTGTNTGDQTISLTGNVTGSGTGSFATTIADSAVTYAKIQNVSATDKVLGRSSSGAGVVEEITCTAAGRALIDDATASDQRTTLGLGTLATQSGTFSGSSSGTNTGDQDLSGLQPLDGELTAIAGLASAADKLPYFSGSGLASLADFTAAGRALVDDADAATQRTTLGLVIGTNVQAYDADLTTWAGITPGTGVGTFLATPSSANLRSALTDENGTGAALFNGATTPDFTTGITIGGAAGSRKVLVGDGTKFAASTETYATPGTSGNILTSDGTNWTSAAPVVTASSTNTFTNKRITPRVTAISSNATWSPSADTDDVYEITAQAVDATTISNPSGTPVDMQKLIIRVKGTAARALTWSGSQWRASSDLALPTTTTTTKTMYLGFIYNSADTKWDLVAKLDNFT